MSGLELINFLNFLYSLGEMRDNKIYICNLDSGIQLLSYESQLFLNFDPTICQLPLMITLKGFVLRLSDFQSSFDSVINSVTEFIKNYFLHNLDMDDPRSFGIAMKLTDFLYVSKPIKTLFIRKKAL